MKPFIFIVIVFGIINLTTIFITLFIDTGPLIVRETSTIEVPIIWTREVPVIQTSVVVYDITRYIVVTPYGFSSDTPTPIP